MKRANSDPRRRSMPYPSPSPSPSNSSSHHPPVSRPAHTDPETVSRPALFHLQADDDSDDEDEDEYADARSDSPANGARSGDDPLPKKRKVNSNASRYYALLELLQTEAHYLLDLRILVNVRIALYRLYLHFFRTRVTMHGGNDALVLRGSYRFRRLNVRSHTLAPCQL